MELDVNSTSGSGTTYSASYEFTDESAQFVTARALYGDDRDRGPSTIAEDEWMSGQGISGDRINYWGWRRHWAEQHFHGPGYVFPEWFIQDQDYWALPPPWLSLPYGPGALPVEVHTEPLVLSASSTYLGGVGEISGTYKSESGSYDSNIRALVYIDGSYAGDADLLPRTPPGPGEEDPGQSFTYDIPARNLGGYEVEFIIIDGGSTASTVLQLEIEVSPLASDLEFLNAIYEGLYSRVPVGYELGQFYNRLQNGELTRPQLIGELRGRAEFMKARDALLSHKTLVGDWVTVSELLGSVASPTGSGDDHADNEANATQVFFNQVIQGRIDMEGDEDHFRINSLTPNGSDGIVTITVLPGHPEGLRISGGGYGLGGG